MWLRLGVVVLGFAGCDVVFRLDDLRPCTACDAGADTGSDAPITGDDDGDGVPGASDNCPAAPNPDQHDHDGDAKGDVCDPCPHLPLPSADADNDGDGLGNGCDPRITIAGDSRALFVGFYEAQEITTWGQQPSGLWTVAGGGFLRLANNAVSNATIEIPQTYDDIFVQVGVRGTSLAAGSVPHSFAISAGRSGTAQHDCMISAPTDGGTKELAYDEPGIRISTAWSGQLTQPNPMTLMIDGTHVICAVAGSFPTDLDDPTAGPNTIPHLGGLGFIANLVAVDIDYVFVATPGP